eukprot:TRINITY_DN6908_c0_g1_i1.p1 TRINITY_DN6908_c0_g1~~TRINITY_DN6908_c0_g1_i1.p1  ORF type:complete len:151 (+),score=22.33 TRINITY_DN6908_c0_g1_i1:846-1298(+)
MEQPAPASPEPEQTLFLEKAAAAPQQAPTLGGKMEQPAPASPEPEQTLRPNTQASPLGRLIEHSMSPADAQHCLLVLDAHKLTLAHMLRGLGFYSSTGSSQTRRENQIKLLTAESSADPPRPSMEKQCAERLIEVIAEGARHNPHALGIV